MRELTAAEIIQIGDKAQEIAALIGTGDGARRSAGFVQTGDGLVARIEVHVRTQEEMDALVTACSVPLPPNTGREPRRE